MSRPVIYLAGPFRAPTRWQQKQNCRRAEALALEVWKLGGICLCVHAMCANYEGELPDEVWLEGDLELLRRSDAVLMAPGWEHSSGSCAEYKLSAIELRKPTFLTLKQLEHWISYREAAE